MFGGQPHEENTAAHSHRHTAARVTAGGPHPLPCRLPRFLGRAILLPRSHTPPIRRSFASSLRRRPPRQGAFSRSASACVSPTPTHADRR